MTDIQVLSPLRFVLVAAIVSVSISTQTINADEIWSEDAAASVETAKSEKKDLLLLFTGSDWCPPCMKLEKEILSQEDFFENANDKFVLVKFDFPQTVEQEQALKDQNNEWQKRFGVTSYPTIVLVDSELKPYAFTGSRDGTAADYVAHLDELHAAKLRRDDFFKEAEKAKGAERAQLLDKALSEMTTEIAEVYYEDVIEEIVELDKDDNAGLRTKYYAAKDRQRRKELMTDIALASRIRKPADAIAYIDQRMTEIELPAEMKLQALNLKLQLLQNLGKFDDSMKLLDEMIAIPELTTDGVQRLVVKKVYLIVGSGDKEGALEFLDQQIRERAENLMLVVAKGELLDSMGKYNDAVKAYDRAMVAAASQPDLLVELVGAKADALCELGKQDDALAALDKFVSNANMPADLRAESLLHKAMILREMDLKTAAIRAEAKALETVETPVEKGEFQKLVEQIRSKREKAN